MIDQYGHLLSFLAVGALGLVAFRLGAPAEITGPISLALGALVVQLARRAPTEKP